MNDSALQAKVDEVIGVLDEYNNYQIQKANAQRIAEERELRFKKWRANVLQAHELHSNELQAKGPQAKVSPTELQTKATQEQEPQMRRKVGDQPWKKNWRLR